MKGLVIVACGAAALMGAGLVSAGAQDGLARIERPSVPSSADAVSPSPPMSAPAPRRPGLPGPDDRVWLEGRGTTAVGERRFDRSPYLREQDTRGSYTNDNRYRSRNRTQPGRLIERYVRIERYVADNRMRSYRRSWTRGRDRDWNIDSRNERRNERPREWSSADGRRFGWRRDRDDTDIRR
jgi:hypothetical protein